MKPNDVMFKGIKVDFSSNGLDRPSPLYSIFYEHEGIVYQGYYARTILAICRCLISYFGMSNDDIELALKSVTDSITEACGKLQDKEV